MRMKLDTSMSEPIIRKLVLFSDRIQIGSYNAVSKNGTWMVRGKPVKDISPTVMFELEAGSEVFIDMPDGYSPEVLLNICEHVRNLITLEKVEEADITTHRLLGDIQEYLLFGFTRS